MLPNSPDPRGEVLSLNLFIDSSHAKNLVIRRSHTGFICFIGKLATMWYSKIQNIVKLESFGGGGG